MKRIRAPHPSAHDDGPHPIPPNAVYCGDSFDFLLELVDRILKAKAQELPPLKPRSVPPNLKLLGSCTFFVFGAVLSNFRPYLET
jgi:hypothetical protein